MQTIQAENVSKFFTSDSSLLKIFDNLSYTFEKNKSYAIVGTSGIGKSTLLHMLAGIDQPSSGTISLNETIISSLPLQQRTAFLQKSIGVVFQQSYLLNELSVLENILLKPIIQGTVTDQDHYKAHNLLKEINLKDKAHTTPNTLSGGQQQKVAILRAIFQAPQFLLADEPTGNLDETSGQQILHLLQQYQSSYGVGLIISTHDMNIAKQLDCMLKIENKQIREIKNK